MGESNQATDITDLSIASLCQIVARVWLTTLSRVLRRPAALDTGESAPHWKRGHKHETLCRDGTELPSRRRDPQKLNQARQVLREPDPNPKGTLEQHPGTELERD